MGGHVLASVPGGVAELACYQGTSQPLDSRNGRNVWLVAWVIARVLAYQETAGPLARSVSLRFAPPVSGCHAVNAPVELVGAGTHSGL